MEWTVKRFDELTVHELYAILRLRNAVFAIEQNCVYPDMDNKDQPSFHCMGWSKGLSEGALTDPRGQDNTLVAYTRLLPPGVAYTEPSIGRVVTARSARGTGAGRELMEHSIQQCYQLFGRQPIRIGAQLYLLRFYTSLGFSPTGAVYLEDGIEHIEMILA